MKKDSLSENHLNNLPNTTIDVGFVVDQNPMLEILVFAEFVWEHTQGKVLLCDLENLVGKKNLLLSTKSEQRMYCLFVACDDI